jgi:beta-glucosidase
VLLLVVFVRCNIRDGATNYTELVENITGVEAIIYVGGISQSMEGEGGDKSGIDLPDVQKELLVALKGLKVPLIEVICTGSYC